MCYSASEETVANFLLTCLANGHGNDFFINVNAFPANSLRGTQLTHDITAT